MRVRTRLLHSTPGPEGGGWFAVDFGGEVYTSVELVLSGVMAETHVRSRVGAPPPDPSASPASVLPLRRDAYEVRFATRPPEGGGAEGGGAEGGGAEGGECAVVTDSALPDVALYRRTLSLTQVVEGNRTEWCAMTIFVYAPRVSECTVRVRSGSHALDAEGVVYLRADAPCDDESGRGPSAPPPSPAGPPASPPRASPSGPPVPPASPPAPSAPGTPVRPETTVALLVAGTAAAAAAVAATRARGRGGPPARRRRTHTQTKNKKKGGEATGGDGRLAFGPRSTPRACSWPG